MRNKIPIIIFLIAILALISLGLFSYFKKPTNVNENNVVQNKNGSRYELLTIDWSKVDPVWKTFAEQHIERMRQAESNTPRSKLPGYKFDRVFVEIKNPFISKFLPNYQFYTEKYFTFAFNKGSKEITSIANGWGAVGDDPYYRNQEFSDFIKTQKIQITDKQNAIEFLKLVEDIYRWFDSDNVNYWRFKAEKENNIWVVRYEYIGPPENSIMLPPVWEIVTNGQNYVTEVRQQRKRF